MIRLRRARIEDHATLELLDALDQRTIGMRYEYKEQPGSAWWLLVDGDNIAGFCGAVHIPREKAIFLARAGVLPDWRGLGLHRRLIRARLRCGRKLGAKWAITYTMPRNVQSSRHLIREGFLPYIPEWSWEGVSVDYWQRGI